MNLVRYTRSPGLLDTIQKEISDLLTETGSMETTVSWKPRVDIQSKDNEYVVYADIPGVDPKDINVSLDGNVLTIEGHREAETKDEKDGYSRIERFQGNFYRQFSLPENVVEDGISAHSEHGVLQLNIPKRQKQSAKKIEVKTKQ